MNQKNKFIELDDLQLNNESPYISHIILEDGSIWDKLTASFIKEMPERTFHVLRLKDTETLIEFLKINDFRLGELTPTEELAAKLRTERNKRLTATDYLIMPDYPCSNGDAVREYRQKLRDMPTWEGFPWDGGGSKTPWPVLEL